MGDAAAGFGAEADISIPPRKRAFTGQTVVFAVIVADDMMGKIQRKLTAAGFRKHGANALAVDPFRLWVVAVKICAVSCRQLGHGRQKVWVGVTQFFQGAIIRVCHPIFRFGGDFG